MMRIVFLLLLLLSTPSFAAETPGAKVVPEIDALRLEAFTLALQAVRAEMGRLQEREARILEQAVWYRESIARRDGVVGWHLQLPERRWLPPESKKEP